MMLKISLAVAAILVVFLIYVATRPNTFHYEVSDIIDAPVEKVFPFLSDLKKGGEWSPFERVDPNLVKEFVGESDRVGAKLIFKGNKEAGAGSIEITEIALNERVRLRLIMTEPMKAENDIEYSVIDVNGKTKFTWVMSGEVGFLGKLVNVIIDCEKMIVDQFHRGISNLKTVTAGE